MSTSSPTPQYNEKLRSPHNGEFYFWVTHCPACKLEFRLLWPLSVTRVRLQAVVRLKCPGCQRWSSRQIRSLGGHRGWMRAVSDRTCRTHRRVIHKKYYGQNFLRVQPLQYYEEILTLGGKHGRGSGNSVISMGASCRAFGDLLPSQ